MYIHVRLCTHTHTHTHIYIYIFICVTSTFNETTIIRSPISFLKNHWNKAYKAYETLFICGRSSVGRPRIAYLQQLCKDMWCSQETYQEWYRIRTNCERERVGEICASCSTLYILVCWCIYIYIYIYIIYIYIYHLWCGYMYIYIYPNR